MDVQNDLPIEVMEHINKYKNKDDRKRSYTGYKLLDSNILKPYKISFDGKPSIEGIYFNISHDMDMVAVAIGDLAIGVDIMKVRSFDQRVLERIGNDTNAQNDYEATMLWAMKEAAIKLEGLSVAQIKKIDTSKYLYDIIDKDDYIIAICYGRGI